MKIKYLTYKEFQNECDNHIYDSDVYGDCKKCPFKKYDCITLATYLARQDQLKEYGKSIEKILDDEIE